MSATTCVCRLCEEPFETDNPRAVFCPKIHYRECVVCGSSFEVKNKRRPAVTCSPACAAAHRRASNPETLYDCTCLLCGEPFKSKQAKAKFCDRDHYKTCENCGKEYRIKDKYRPGVACSQSCASALSHTDESRAKRRKNNLEKYGVEYSFQRDDVKAKIAASPEHQASLIGGEKFRKAMLDKYGVENYGATEEHRRFLSENNPMYNSENVEKIRQTSLEKYGVDWVSKSAEVQEKFRVTSLERYGVETPLVLPKAREAAKKSSREKYGTDYPFESELYREHVRKVCLEKYGVDWPSKVDEVKEKAKATNLERYGVENVFQSEEIKARCRASLIERYGVDNPQASPEILAKSNKTREANGKTHNSRVSKLNRKFAASLKDEFGIETIFEKAVGRCSFDLALPGTNILIDLNPTVTHNLTVPYACVLSSCGPNCDTHKTISTDYHYRRAKVAMKEGFRLIQVFDWDDPEKIKRLIYNKVRTDLTKLSARKCELKPVDRKVANAFFDEHHIQGSVRGGKAFYGLFDGGELVAAASFGPARFNKDYEWEWLRYSVKDGYLVHGGPGALFKRFREDFNPKTVVSFVDFAHTTGETFFPSLGFTELPLRPSSAVWFNLASGKSVRDSSLVRLGADKLLGTNYGSREECGLGNEEIMAVEGFLKVPTAGNRTFLWSDK